MNFIIQDNTAMTLETNLVKIIEEILYDEKGGRLTIAEIAESIKKRVDLSFSNEEIKTAIRKKRKTYPKHRAWLYFETRLQKDVIEPRRFQFKNIKVNSASNKRTQFECAKKLLIDLLKEYLYFCFNSNKNSILALLDNVKENGEQFKKSESDIKLINLFLNWENEGKNKFVYNIVSYGYVYCSLTVKKDEILANRLFRGKNLFQMRILFLDQLELITM